MRDQKSMDITFSFKFSSRYAKTRTSKFRKVVRQHTGVLLFGTPFRSVQLTAAAAADIAAN